MHSSETDIGQFCLLSSFSEFTVVPDISVVVVDKAYPLNRAVLASCAVPTGVGAVLHRAKVPSGSTVMVIGCGGVGVNIIQGAKLAGASMIIAVDVHDFKLEMAKKLGATHVINAREQNPVRAAKQLTDGFGVDYAFEAISTPETIGQAAAATGKNGTIVIVGLTDAKVTSMPIPPMLFVLAQKTIMGTIYGDSQPQKDIPALLALYKDGKLKLDELVTRTYTLDQVNEAYNDTLQGRTIRGVIEFK